MVWWSIISPGRALPSVGVMEDDVEENVSPRITLADLGELRDGGRGSRSVEARSRGIGSGVGTGLPKHASDESDREEIMNETRAPQLDGKSILATPLGEDEEEEGGRNELSNAKYVNLSVDYLCFLQKT